MAMTGRARHVAALCSDVGVAFIRLQELYYYYHRFVLRRIRK